MIPVAIKVAIGFVLGVVAVLLMTIEPDKRDYNSPTT